MLEVSFWLIFGFGSHSNSAGSSDHHVDKYAQISVQDWLGKEQDQALLVFLSRIPSFLTKV